MDRPCSMKAITSPIKLLDDFWSLIKPNTCPGCHDVIEGQPMVDVPICDHCMTNLTRIPINGNADNNPVAKVFWGRVEVESVVAYTFNHPESTIRSLVHQFKYHNQPQIAYYLGRQFGHELLKFPISSCDLIIPVPLSPKRLQQRGYNQSLQIAQGIADLLKTPILEDVLLRSDASPNPRHSTYSRHSKSLASQNRSQRIDSIQGKFHLQNENQIIGKHILLVDDIITTGSTLEACAQAILTKSPIKLSLAALGYTPLKV